MDVVRVHVLVAVRHGAGYGQDVVFKLSMNPIVHACEACRAAMRARKSDQCREFFL